MFVCVRNIVFSRVVSPIERLGVGPVSQESKRLNQKKKELYKLAVARSDVTAALDTCDLLLPRVKTLRDTLYFPLQNAIIVCYARPFTQNKPFGPLSNKWQKFSTKRLQETHELLLTLRDKTIAHSDLKIRKVFIHPPGTPLARTGIVTDNLGLAISNQALPLERIQEVRDLCYDLGYRLNIEAEKMLKFLFGSKHLPPESFELIFNDEK